MAKAHLLENKAAIITGAGAGIGYATASEFAKEGAKVMIAEMREDRGVQAADEIAKATGAEVRLRCFPNHPDMPAVPNPQAGPRGSALMSWSM